MKNKTWAVQYTVKEIDGKKTDRQMEVHAPNIYMALEEANDQLYSLLNQDPTVTDWELFDIAMVDCTDVFM